MSARLQELAERLVAPGAKAEHVSTSETHEISDGIRNLISERDEAVRLLRCALDHCVGCDACMHTSEFLARVGSMKQPEDEGCPCGRVVVGWCKTCGVDVGRVGRVKT